MEGKNDRVGLAPENDLGTLKAKRPFAPSCNGPVDNHRLPVNPTSACHDRFEDAGGSMQKEVFHDNEAANRLAAARSEADPVKHWVPFFLRAYSGARLSEICQLRVQDIAEVNGIWCMKIVPEAGWVKTAGSERIVPLHPAVIEAGFLQYVSNLTSGPIFPALPPDRFGKRGGNGTKVIGPVGASPRPDRKRLSPSHSWRHRFKTMSRRHGS